MKNKYYEKFNIFVLFYKKEEEKKKKMYLEEGWTIK